MNCRWVAAIIKFVKSIRISLNRSRLKKYFTIYRTLITLKTIKYFSKIIHRWNIKRYFLIVYHLIKRWTSLYIKTASAICYPDRFLDKIIIYYCIFFSYIRIIFFLTIYVIKKKILLIKWRRKYLINNTEMYFWVLLNRTSI